ncbi:MAG: endonuclease/exonuclease/phosphatase family protein, partial [Proteobacteria bacterium]|nr:endonuclease/exonuclease/phosphatase family protein [Pseudomonadota bacterium]
WIKICHLNIRGYLNHMNDLKQDNNICTCDIICLTETHLKKSDVIHTNSQPNKNYIQYRRDRVAGVDKGGIIMFVHPRIKSTMLNVSIPKLEFAATVISPAQTDELIIITIYRRANSVSTQNFTQMVEKLLSAPELHEKNILVLGDFNEDLMESKTNICSFFQQYQFKQLIHQPTTNQGSLLDHIYFNGSATTKTEVYDTYYSDHDTTFLAIQKDSS